MKIGLFLESKRIRKEKTLRDFCKEHNVCPVKISKIERNKIEFTEEVLSLCSKIYNTPVNELKKLDLTTSQELTESELVQKLPIFLNKNLSKEQLNQIIEIIKKA